MERLMGAGLALAGWGRSSPRAARAARPTDATGPACNGVSPASLVAEQTQAGQCPATPTTLTGTGAAGGRVLRLDAADCLPQCCSCPGTGGTAAVAECNGGNCLAGEMACCLYGLHCTQ